MFYRTNINNSSSHDLPTKNISWGEDISWGAASWPMSHGHAQSPHLLRFFDHAVPAGFPSPADDYMDQKLDLNSYLIKHPMATYFMRCANNAMQGCGIYQGDLLIVDKSLKAGYGKMIIAAYEGRLILRRLTKTPNGAALCASNPDYPTIPLNEESDFAVWGVVTNVIHQL